MPYAPTHTVVLPYAMAYTAPAAPAAMARIAEAMRVPDAAAGEWAYTVTPLSIPYPNYPFSLTIGEH